MRCTAGQPTRRHFPHSLNELTKILEILEEITKDVEPESRLSLAKQLPLIVQVSVHSLYVAECGRHKNLLTRALG